MNSSRNFRKWFAGLGLAAAFSATPALANISSEFSSDSSKDNFAITSCAPSSSSLADVWTDSTNAGTYRMCLTTPSKYEITLYKVGICTANPLTGTAVDLSSCFIVFNSTGGTSVDLGNLDSPIPLTAPEIRPDIGTYTNMFMLMGNSIRLKGSYTTAAGTFNTQNNSNSHGGKWTHSSALASAQQFDHTFDKYGFGGTGCKATYQRTLSDGQIRAVITNNDSTNSTLTYQTEESGGQCAGTVTRVAGVWKPSTPLEITGQTNGLELRFLISDGGIQIESEDDWHNSENSDYYKQPSWAYAGDFKPTFITY